MVFVSFHGGKGGINNLYAYTSALPAKKLTHSALSATANNAELRALVLQNGLLYVADGAKSQSVVYFYTPVTGTPFKFDQQKTFIGPNTAGGPFTTAISHPYSIAFDAASHAFIGNQDTNVVALVNVQADGSGALPSGCQSQYLTAQFPQGVFLDGTFVASQVGGLPNVGVAATDIPPSNGGLAIWPTSGKIQHSVRDVIVNGQTLIVCDEASACLRIYSVSTGTFLNSICGFGSNLPTHLQIINGGLYVSAGAALYWMPLPDNNGSACAPLVNILSIPDYKIAGIACSSTSGNGTLYVALQGGTAGAIYQYAISPSTPTVAPQLTNQTVFMDATLDPKFTDIPEFLLYQPDVA